MSEKNAPNPNADALRKIFEDAGAIEDVGIPKSAYTPAAGRPPRTRAKFRVIRHEQAEGNVYHPATDKYGAGVWHAVVLQAVSGNSEENKQFYAATPNGEIRMSMVRAETAALFPIGAEIYVDFTLAE